MKRACLVSVGPLILLCCSDDPLGETERPPLLVSISHGPSYDFGTVPMGSAVTETFVVTNTGEIDVVLGELSSAELGLAEPFALATTTCVASAVLPAGGACDLAVTFTPDGDELASKSIQLAYDSDEGAGTAQRALTGTGTFWLWTRQLGGAQQDLVGALGLDATGNVYLTISGPGPLDGFTHQGQYDGYVVKHDTTGTKLWTKQIATSGDDYVEAIAIASDGSIYVGGGTEGDLDGNTNVGSDDAYLMKLDSAGDRVWTRMLATTSYEGIVAVLLDGAGGIYVAGQTGGSLDGTSPADVSDIVVARYDDTGTLDWLEQISSPGNDAAWEMALDSSGMLYVVGASFGDLAGTNAGASDIIILKLDDTGAPVWSRQVGTSEVDVAVGVAIDASDNVYVAGFTMGGLNGNVHAGNKDMFVMRYDAAGTRQWTTQIGSVDFDEGHEVVVDSEGDIYVSATINTGFDGETGFGGNDAALVKLAPSGARLWTHVLGTQAHEYQRGLAIHTDGTLYFGGITEGGLLGHVNAGFTDAFVAKHASTVP